MTNIEFYDDSDGTTELNSHERTSSYVRLKTLNFLKTRKFLNADRYISVFQNHLTHFPPVRENN